MRFVPLFSHFLSRFAHGLNLTLSHVFDYASTASQLCTLAAQFTSASLATRSTLIAIAIVHQSAFPVRSQLRRNLAEVENTSFPTTTSTYRVGQKFCDILCFACISLQEHDKTSIFLSKDAPSNSLQHTICLSLEQ